jgi:hypothetical protein
MHQAHKSDKTDIQTIPCNRGHVTIINHQNTLTIIDPGVIGQSIGAPNWAEYTLIPHITKTTGKIVIDHLILLQPNAMIFKAVATLSSKVIIKNVYLPYWKGTFTRYTWSHFFAFKNALQQTKTVLHRLGTYQPQTIKVCSKTDITITPLKGSITYQEASYTPFCVTVLFDTQEIQIQSYKYENFNAKTLQK